MTTAAIIQPVSVEGALIEIAEAANGPWAEITGGSDYSEGGGAAPSQSLATFAGSVSAVGAPDVPTVSVEIPAAMPLLAGYKSARAAFTGRLNRFFRFTTREEIIIEADGADGASILAATGVVTFTGTPPPFTSVRPGATLELAAAKYIIEKVNDPAGKLTLGEKPGADVPDGDYKIIVAQLRRGPFRARVTNFDRARARSGGYLGTTLELQPEAELPAWVRV